MNSSIVQKTDGEIILTIQIPWKDISEVYEKTVENIVRDTEIDGFRKGKAPRNLIENKLEKAKVYEEVIKDVLPRVYTEAVKTHKLTPIVSPKIELKEAEEKKDWTILAHTCQRPTVKLGEYKNAIRDLKAGKSKKIWLPGEKPEKENDAASKQPTLDQLIDELYKNVTCEIPDILTENEVNRMLSDLLDQTKKLGLTVEQYLSAKNKTAESIKQEYKTQSKKMITMEFALEQIADTEGIILSDDDIDKAIEKNAKTDSEKEALQKERYYLATILRRQKTLDFLASL